MFVHSKDLISYRSPLEKMSIKEVGGKGWNLFCLYHFGFPVPPWCVVSSSVFDKVLGIQRASIRDILTSIDFTDPNALGHASLQIRDLIIHLKFTEQFSQKLFQTLQDIFRKESHLSVRSSVIGEDSVEHSFAGQMDSFLNVRTPEVLETIKKVWASAFSSRALVYRQRKNLSLSDISTAVIIQEMVQSVVSGVLFTRVPESRAKECLISAGFGLGEGVVADKVKTDTYRINWDSNEISKDIPVKDYRIVLNTTTQHENRIESVPTPMQSQQVLADMQIQQLRDVGIKVEECFGNPQDIEWAYDVHGRLSILQARPIVFTKPKEPHTIRIWDNSNIVESYPGLTLPLTFTFIRNGYESSLRNAALGFIAFRNSISKDLHIFKNMVGLLDGRVYYNLLNWYQILSYLPGFKKYKVSWDQMIGIKEQIDFPQSGISHLNRFLTLMIMFWRLLTAKRNAEKFFSHFYTVYNNFRDKDISTATEDEVIHLYESLAMKLKDKWHMTLYNDFCAIKYYDWLKQLCRKWNLDKCTGLHNHLLCGEQGVESVAPVHSLIRLAEIFRTKSLYRKLINEDSNHIIWQKIQNYPAYTALKTAIEAHLESFGDRSPEELKLEKPSFREEPELLIQLIKNYYQMGLSIGTIEKREQDVRKNAEKIVRQHLKNPLKRLVFEFVLRNARFVIANRENMRFARSRLYGIVRRLFQRMADIFVEKSLIELASDIYYLSIEEVFGFVQGTSVTKNLKALVDTRKGEYAEFMKRNPKERIHTQGIPYMSSFYGIERRNCGGKTLKGIGCSSGIAEGKAKVTGDPHAVVGCGDYILVTTSTDPGWVFLMISSKGIIVEKGSILSHTAIIGRELGIPTIVDVKDATKIIPDGAEITINGNTGEIRWQ